MINGRLGVTDIHKWKASTVNTGSCNTEKAPGTIQM